MNIDIKCSQCEQPLLMASKVYQKHLLSLGITTKDEFNHIYICRKCRGKILRSSSFNCLYASPEFKKLQQILQEQVTLVVQRGVHDSAAQEHFANSVKNILDTYLIKDYIYDIVNNKLMGIVLNAVPFFGKIYIKLNSEGT